MLPPQTVVQCTAISYCYIHLETISVEQHHLCPFLDFDLCQRQLPLNFRCAHDLYHVEEKHQLRCHDRSIVIPAGTLLLALAVVLAARLPFFATPETPLLDLDQQVEVEKQYSQQKQVLCRLPSEGSR